MLCYLTLQLLAAAASDEKLGCFPDNFPSRCRNNMLGF
jgi:hypothetical protein